MSTCRHDCDGSACACIHADATTDHGDTAANTHPVGAGHMPVTGLAAHCPEPSRSADGFNFPYSPFPADASY